MNWQPIESAVWVIIKNDGYEGYRLPQMAFKSHALAEQAMQLVPEWDRAGWEIVEIPLWKTEPVDSE